MVKAELKFSNNLLTSQNLDFSKHRAYQELFLNNINYYDFLLKHDESFCEILDLFQKKLCEDSRFRAPGLGLDVGEQAGLALICIIKALTAIDVDTRAEFGISGRGMVNRDVFRAELDTYARMAMLLGENNYLSKLIKLTMLLEKHNYVKKHEVKVKEGLKVKSIIFLKFELGLSLRFSQRLKSGYSLRPFIFRNRWFFSQSYLGSVPALKRGGGRPANKNSTRVLEILAKSGFVFKKIFAEKQLEFFEAKLQKELNVCGSEGLAAILDSYEATITRLEFLQQQAYERAQAETKRLRKFPWNTVMKIIPPLANFLKTRNKLMYKNAFALRERIREKQSILQKNSLVCLLEKAVRLRRPIYTAYFKDFRGRFYANSNLHPMYTKALRALVAPSSSGSLNTEHSETEIIDCTKL